MFLFSGATKAARPISEAGVKFHPKSPNRSAPPDLRSEACLAAGGPFDQRYPGNRERHIAAVKKLIGSGPPLDSGVIFAMFSPPWHRGVDMGEATLLRAAHVPGSSLSRSGPLRAGAVVQAAAQQKPKLFDQVRDAIRTRH